MQTGCGWRHGNKSIWSCHLQKMQVDCNCRRSPTTCHYCWNALSWRRLVCFRSALFLHAKIQSGITDLPTTLTEDVLDEKEMVDPSDESDVAADSNIIIIPSEQSDAKQLVAHLHKAVTFFETTEPCNSKAMPSLLFNLKACIPLLQTVEVLIRVILGN